MNWVLDASVALRWFIVEETYDGKAHQLIEAENLSCLLTEHLPEDW